MTVPAVAKLTVRDLLCTSIAITDELRSRGYIRAHTSIGGEILEGVVALAYSGSLERPAEKSKDLIAADGRRIQVKTRNLPVGDMRHFPFSDFDFDIAVVASLDRDTFDIIWAREIPVVELRAIASPHAKDGFRVRMLRARDAGIDVTERLNASYRDLQ
jgi:hypothetical protein